MLRARSEFLILFSLTFGLFLQKLTANGFTDWQEDGLLRQEALTAVWQLRQTDLKTDNKPLLVSSTPPVFWVQTADACLLQLHALVAFFCRCVCFHIATNLQTYITVRQNIWYKFVQSSFPVVDLRGVSSVLHQSPVSTVHWWRMVSWAGVAKEINFKCI